MGKGGGDITVGYRYYFGIHMGIGRGELDELVEIRVGDLTAWPLALTTLVGYDPFGNPVYENTPAPGPIGTNGTIQIQAPDLFGGDSGEGGIVGPLDVMMGGPTQGINAKLAAMLGGLVPAFRGVATFFFDGLVCSLNPYPKAWKFRVRRALKGWDGDVFYPQKAVIILCGDIYAMNPAHMIYECATNRDWGRGLTRDSLNIDSFISCANTLANECFGLCLKWARSDDIQVFVQSVLDHVGGVLYIDRGTGLLTMRLIRADYDPTAIPTFDDNSGLLDVSDDDSSSSDSLYNEIIVNWHDPIEDEDHQMRVQNIAGMQITGSVSSKTIDYPGIPVGDLAARVAQRDLGVYGLTLRRVKITLDRRGWKVEPGMPFKISSALRGIDGMIFRAGRIEDNTNGDSTITIGAVQDIFGMPATSYISVQPPVNSNPDKQPVPVAIHTMMEVPYRELARTLSKADLANVEDDAGAVFLLGVKPQPLALGFEVMTCATGEAYADHGRGDFSGSALVSTMDYETKNITLTQVSDLENVQIGTFAVIENECVRVDAIDTTALTCTVARGIMDTLPNQHASGARIWFVQSYNGQDGREYAIGETVSGKELTRTTNSTLNFSLAAVDTLNIVGRHAMPYICAGLTLGGFHWYQNVINIKGDCIFVWAHRDRITQADQLIDQDAASVGPEPGTTYNVRIYDPTDTLLHEETGVTTAGITIGEDVINLGHGAKLRAEIEAVRGGITSYQKYNFNFKHYLTTDAGWDSNYDQSWGE